MNFRVLVEYVYDVAVCINVHVFLLGDAPQQQQGTWGCDATTRNHQVCIIPQVPISATCRSTETPTRRVYPRQFNAPDGSSRPGHLNRWLSDQSLVCILGIPCMRCSVDYRSSADLAARSPLDLVENEKQTASSTRNDGYKAGVPHHGEDVSMKHRISCAEPKPKLAQLLCSCCVRVLLPWPHSGARYWEATGVSCACAWLPSKTTPLWWRPPRASSE